MMDDQFRAAYARRSAAGGLHPDESIWERFACGELMPEERAGLADHISHCAECADVHRAVAYVMREARAFDAAAPAPPPGGDSGGGGDGGEEVSASDPRRLRVLLACAAAVLLAVAVATYRSQLPSSGAASDTPAGAAADARDATAAEGQAPAPTPLPPSYRTALEAPAVTLPADLIVVMRAPAGAPAPPFLAEFGSAIEPYRAGRFGDAAERLRLVAARHPDRVEVWFYLGVSELLSERADEALAAFDRAGDGGAARDDLPWYRAAALERAGRADEATRALTALCAQPGRWRARACAAVAP